jgi:hypothetical protein
VKPAGEVVWATCCGCGGLMVLRVPAGVDAGAIRCRPCAQAVSAKGGG